MANGEIVVATKRLIKEWAEGQGPSFETHQIRGQIGVPLLFADLLITEPEGQEEAGEMQVLEDHKSQIVGHLPRINLGRALQGPDASCIRNCFIQMKIVVWNPLNW